jgi:hypothetical protein
LLFSVSFEEGLSLAGPPSNRLKFKNVARGFDATPDSYRCPHTTSLCFMYLVEGQGTVDRLKLARGRSRKDE